MSDTSNNTTEIKELKRSGIGLAQPDRQLAAMQGTFYGIEERSFSEWMAYMRSAAEKIRFYDSDVSSYSANQAVLQNWQGALPDEAQSLALETLLAGGIVSNEISELAARPDIASLLTFFSLMAYPKQQFTDFTSAHQQHYYQTVLGFSPNSVSPDSVNLVVTLNDDTAGMTLPAGTVFNGGTDLNDQPLLYKTLANAVLNHTQIMKLSTLSGVSDDQRVFTRQIDMDNGLELSSDGIYTFGDDVLEDAFSEYQSHSQIGFTLASPALFLAGGNRTVKLKFEYSDNSTLQLMSWFDIAISTSEGMVLLDASESPEEIPAWSIAENVSIANSDGSGLEEYDLVLTFNSLFPAITGLEGDLENGVPSLPHLYCMLKPEKEAQAIVLKRTVFERLRLDIDVAGLQGVFAENQNNALDTTGPIEPFTSQPSIGSRFTFTHPELLVKTVSKANLFFDWLGRPENLDDYYRVYSYYRYIQDNPDSTMEEWDTLNWITPNVTLGRSDSIAALANQSVFSSQLPVNNIDSHEIPFINDADSDYPNGKIYDWNELPFEESKASLWPKFYTLTLADNDLGYSDYNQVLQFIAYYNSQQLQAETTAETVIVDGTATVDGTVIIYGTVTVDSAGKVTGDGTIIGNGTVTGDGTVVGNGTVTSSGTVTVAGTATVNGSITVRGTLTVNSEGVLSGNGSVTGNGTMTGDGTITGDGTVTGNGTVVDESFTPIQVPAPYVPTLNDVYLSYSSSTTISMDALAASSEPILQSVLPIGRPQVPAASKVAILPLMAESAYLYIGLSQVTTPGQVRLYFQIDPVDGSNINDYYSVDWRYLSVDGFQSIPKSSLGTQAGNARIVEDSTQDLLNSGVLAIEFPAISDELSGLGDGLLWLQLSIYNGDKNRVNYSRIKGVYSQGVTAELVVDGIDSSHFIEPLPALSVTELDEVDSRISEVLQPWPSFGASIEETEAQLSIRASERLRHKQRALTRWDYEHLVLNEFPEVYLARCYVPEEDGDIELMLVPVNYDSSILQPKLPLYLHENIQAFVSGVCPFGVEVKVRDPLYEEVTFDAALKIYTGNDIDSVVSRLSQKLIDHLTPWQSSVDSEVVFKKSIYLTSLAAMLEEDEAVDIVHYLKATILTDGDYRTIDSTTNVIEPSSDASILVPSQKQKITLVDQDVEVVSGIGKWRIELDFTVG